LGILNKEMQIIQNPAFGAVLLWQFCSGYLTESRTSEFIPMPLLFIVLPILLNEEIASYISSTRKQSGLRKFVGKFLDSRNSKGDILLSINKKMLKMHNLTMESLVISINSGLIVLDIEHGLAIPVSSKSPRKISSSIENSLKNAKKLGEWCSKLSIFEISFLLKVGF
jgi:hypothetical protein